MRYHYETIGFIDKRRIRMTKHVPMTLFPTVRPFFTKNTSRLHTELRTEHFQTKFCSHAVGKGKRSLEENAGDRRSRSDFFE
jgi:hypothetical protein